MPEVDELLISVAEFDSIEVVECPSEGSGLNGRNLPRRDGSLTLFEEVGEIEGSGVSGLIVTGSISLTENSGQNDCSLRVDFFALECGGRLT